MKNKHIIKYTKYNYPLYLYTSKKDINYENPPNFEIHITLDTVSGTCNAIACARCPIHEACENNESVIEHIPELKKEYPELLI